LAILYVSGGGELLIVAGFNDDDGGLAIAT
jgi:hypothetical protein